MTKPHVLPPPFAYAGGYAPDCAGIHAFHLDERGQVQARLAVTLPGSPSWLHLTDDGRQLHALLEEAHAVASFAVDPADGTLSLLSQQATGGKAPVHLLWDREGAWVAHYGDGRLTRLPVRSDGALAAADLTIEAPPGAAPHAHMVCRHPRWPLMMATDLGLDRLRIWRRSAAAEDPIELPGLSLPPGSGPRHMVCHPRDPSRFYVLNELANALDAGRIDEQGRLSIDNRISSLPPGFAGTSYASDLLMAPDGRTLYALNRLHDAIAVFDLDDDGLPSWAGEVWAQGSYPRSATFSPDGRQLWLCLQRSHQLCVFDLDSDGWPQFSGRFIEMPGAACLVFQQAHAPRIKGGGRPPPAVASRRAPDR